MPRSYFSSRTNASKLSVEELYWKVRNLFSFFRNKDFFKEKTGVTEHQLPVNFRHEAAILLNFQPFPMDRWLTATDITQDNIFDVIEFLYDRVSKPGVMVEKTNDWSNVYYDYDRYDEVTGKEEFREMVNSFLANVGDGYELTFEGTILELGTTGLRSILQAEIVAYDEANVDSKVRNAINKWRSRHSSLDTKKEAIRELADVFEWLKKAKNLQSVLNSKDESDIFNIANNFGIRHHGPNQKTNYDLLIWYAWIFHFYLATYHASIRLLKKASPETDKS